MFCLTFLGQSGKHQSGKQDNPTNTKENPADRKIKNSTYKSLKMHKNPFLICVLIIDNNAMESSQVLIGDF